MGRTERIDRFRHSLVPLALVLLTLVVHARTVTFGFVRLDDPGYVTENPHVLGGLTPAGAAWAFTTTHRSNWHPLTWLSLMLDATLGGGWPGVFHATNVALHAANVLLLFHVLSRMTRFRGRSACVAALFAVHPLHVESVAWVVERKDVLSTLFWMLSMLAYTRWAERPGAGRYSLLLVFFSLGLLSKPMLVSLPLVLLVMDFWPLERLTTGKALAQLLREKIPLLVLAAGSCWITLHAQSTGGAVQAFVSFPFATRIANAAVSCAGYLGKMVWPVGLAVPYPYDTASLVPSRVGAAALVLVAISVLAVLWVRSRPWLCAGWAWYLITLVPVIGLVQVGTQSMADRYTYIPLVGPFLFVVWGAADLWGRAARLPRIVSAGAAAAGIVALAATAFVQVGYWRDSTTLFTRAVAVTERNATAHNILGLEMDDRGRLDDAIAHYRDAVRFSTGWTDARINLASALARSGRLDEAASQYAETLRVAPDDLLARRGMGSVLAQQGKDGEATPYLRAAVAADPRDVPTRNNLAALLLRQGLADEAEANLVEVLRLDPHDATAHANLGALLAGRGRAAEAIAHLSEALRLNPNDERVRRNLERVRSLAPQ